MESSAQNSENTPINTLTRTPIATEPEKQENPVSLSSGKEKEAILNHVPDSIDDMPPSLYKEAGRPPYILDLIEGGRLAYETFNVKELSELIDVYINSKADSKEDYKKTLDELIKLSKSDGDVYNKLDHLAEFVRVQNKLIEALKAKEEFEKKNPLEMSSKELAKYINERH